MAAKKKPPLPGAKKGKGPLPKSGGAAKGPPPKPGGAKKKGPPPLKSG